MMTPHKLKERGLELAAPFPPVNPDIYPKGKCIYLVNGSLTSKFNIWILCLTTSQKCRGRCAQQGDERGRRPEGTTWTTSLNRGPGPEIIAYQHKSFPAGGGSQKTFFTGTRTSHSFEHKIFYLPSNLALTYLLFHQGKLYQFHRV